MALIRRGRLGDENGIHDSHMRSIREICVHDHGEEEIKGWGFRSNRSTEHWIKTFDDPQIFIWVVEHENIIEGHAFLRCANEQSSAHIHSLYLTPVVLGLGFGKQLLHEMIDTAKSRGAQEITLDSSITAHEFYKKYGFVDTGLKRMVDIGGYPVSSFPMKYTYPS